MIQSNFRGMGSGLVPDGLGFMFQDRGQLFSLQDGHPNIYAPGKRPFQTIIPGFATRNGAPWLAFGVMGGDMQPQGQTQIIVNRVDYGLDVQAAGDAPRWHHEGSSQRMGEDSPGLGPTGLLRLEAWLPRAHPPGARRHGLEDRRLRRRLRPLPLRRAAREPRRAGRRRARCGGGFALCGRRLWLLEVAL